ncbi:polysaccharide pyruvyl transferase family protein [Mailhella massiliensis]|uniref:Polysaccharide pyruvyl transferase family protein n=1 Tax=Mailhella massiliensis TaxID=1903261 RepID=A0A921AW94_9BACT|nr:polysaccharide pyruvyl transferase family protein [Mailhella massiliensis]HJD97096.1 polysaccharide pyruvyl transferase family protein [Mailhella massiliensis]
MKENSSIVLYWWRDNNNVGDSLSPYIVERVSGARAVSASIKRPGKLCAVGSIINSRTLRSRSVFWGSGCMHAEVRFYQGRALLPFLPSTPSFRAVRGPLTRETLLRAGYRCPRIYGDPALLLPRFYQPKVRRKRYGLGVICHFSHKNLLHFPEEIKLIDVERDVCDVEAFVDEVCECERIVSSSLHGIIIAHAYGIPARQFTIPDAPLMGSGNRKFEDYYLSVGMPVQPPLFFHSGDRPTVQELSQGDETVDLKIDLDLLLEVFPHELIYA